MWGLYAGTIWDWAMFIGSIGLFLSLLFLFIRVLPVISIFEMRTLVPVSVEGDGERGKSASPTGETGPAGSEALSPRSDSQQEGTAP
jgi:hypothetical protein